VCTAADGHRDGCEAHRDANEAAPTAHARVLASLGTTLRRHDQHSTYDANPAASAVAREGQHRRGAALATCTLFTPDMQAVLQAGEPVDSGLVFRHRLSLSCRGLILALGRGVHVPTFPTG